MMTASEIAELQKVRDGACLTVLLPLYNNSPDDQQQTPIRLKNLCQSRSGMPESARRLERRKTPGHHDASQRR